MLSESEAEAGGQQGMAMPCCALQPSRSLPLWCLLSSMRLPAQKVRILPSAYLAGLFPFPSSLSQPLPPFPPFPPPRSERASMVERARMFAEEQHRYLKERQAVIEAARQDWKRRMDAVHEVGERDGGTEGAQKGDDSMFQMHPLVVLVGLYAPKTEGVLEGVELMFQMHHIAVSAGSYVV